MPTGLAAIGTTAASIFGPAAATAGTAAATDAAITLPEVAVTAAAPAAATAAGAGLTAADVGADLALGGTPSAISGVSPTATQLASAAPTTVSDSLSAAPTTLTTGSTGGGLLSAGSGAGPASLSQINTAAVGNPSLPGAIITLSGGDANLAAEGGEGLVPGASTPTTSSGFADALSKAGGTAVDFAKANPGLLLGGGGILASLLMNNSIPGINALKQQQALEQGLGTENLQLAERGQIPGSQQTVLDAAEQAAEAQTRSTFGREGIGGSTMEAQSLAADKIAEAAQKNQIIQQIMNSGIAELGQSGTLANNIMTTEIAQNQDVQNAIAKFAAALAGSSGLKAAA